jgi:hypothetical protein
MIGVTLNLVRFNPFTNFINYFLFTQPKNVKFLIIIRQHHQRRQVQRRSFMHGPRHQQGLQNIFSGALPTETVARLRGASANRVNGEPQQLTGISGV